MTATPQVGDLIDRRFAILELVGRGGMGSVFKALDTTTGRAVALKFPFFEFESEPAFYARFQREIEIGSALDHPGILKILAVNRPSRPYIAMEFVQGETLWDRLERTRPLEVEEALQVGSLICDALVHMHDHNIVHRDLKPTNVMLCHDGSLRIMDFGIAMAGSARRLTFAGFTKRMGTPYYMAPEQVKGQRGDPRTDLFSLGAILYEMTTGHVPYGEQPDLYSVMNARLVGDPIAPRLHNPAIPPEVEEIILRTLARNPTDRYQTAADLKRDLVSPGEVRVTGRVNQLKAPSFMRRRWRIAGTMVVALMMPVLLFFLFLVLLRH